MADNLNTQLSFWSPITNNVTDKLELSHTATIATNIPTINSTDAVIGASQWREDKEAFVGFHSPKWKDVRSFIHQSRMTVRDHRMPQTVSH